MLELWEKIAEAAENCGLKTSYIAKAAELNPSTVNRYRKAQFRKNISRLERFIKVLGYRLVLEKIPDREDVYRKDRLFHLPPLPEKTE